MRSSSTTPAFSFTWKLSSMCWVRSVIWSTVGLPRRKTACSPGSCGSITGVRRLCSSLSKILYGTHSKGRYPFVSSLGLFGLGKAIMLARRQVFGILLLRRRVERKEHIHEEAVSPWWTRNFGWMLSRPAALPTFSWLIALVSSSSVKSPDRFESAPGALESWLTSCDILRAKSLSACWKRPFSRYCVAMAFAEMGHLEGAVDLPVSLLMVCQALRLEWVKSMDSTVSVQRSLRFSFNLLIIIESALSTSSLVLDALCSSHSLSKHSV